MLGSRRALRPEPEGAGRAPCKGSGFLLEPMSYGELSSGSSTGPCFLDVEIELPYSSLFFLGLYCTLGS
jgi:hypothetical protein